MGAHVTSSIFAPRSPWQTPPQLDRDLTRILSLPVRRDLSAEDRAALVEALTLTLRTPSGQQTLREVQAIALLEIAELGGAFIPVRVAGGKTLISLLAPRVLGDVGARPLLIVPAALVEKTRRAHRALSVHWQIPPFYRVMSYQEIGRKDGLRAVEQYAPTCLVCDEAHYLKNPGAGVTKAIRSYLRTKPETAFVGLTGTVSKRSLKDFAHTCLWALHTGAPVPADFHAIASWANVLDEKRTAPEAPPDVGALRALVRPGEPHDVAHVRRGFQRRFRSTPGVVTAEEPPLDIGIVVSALAPEVPREICEAQARVRATWETPDGEVFEEAVAMWRHQRELARGFCYVWDPTPPLEWKLRRAEYHRAVREILAHNQRNLHVPSAVVRAIDEGLYPEARGPLEAWRGIRDTFTPRTRAIWISDYAVDAARDWIETSGRRPSIVWVEHRELGARLAEVTGLPYYAAQALDDKTGRSILDHPKGRHAIASIASVKEGFDLQFHFSSALYLAAPTTAIAQEQSLGRILREGQPEYSIEAAYFLACEEDRIALRGSLADARFAFETLGQDQALLRADWSFEL